MKFIEKGWENPNIKTYADKDIKTAREFVTKLYNEFGDFIKCAVLFGSLSKKESSAESDIDLLVVIDDVLMQVTEELLDTYRIINERIIMDVSPRLHIHTIRLTSYWEFIRNGDPVMINILRDGIALVDSGFFEPFQRMLFQGRIRPSLEAVYNYAEMAPRALFNANLKMLQAIIDLYWAAIDITHAYLMKFGELPSSPRHLPNLMKKYKAFSKRDIELVEYLYNLTKNIIHRKRNVVSAKEFDKLKKDVEKYYEKIRGKIGF